MSFSSNVKNEFNSIQIKGNCCKRSFLLGALMCAEHCNREITVKLSDPSTASKASHILKSLYRLTPNISEINKGCVCTTVLSFNSERLSSTLNQIDSNLLNSSFFECTSCKSAFLRGAFCGCGSVSDPLKSYTLEIRTANLARASFISSLLSDAGITTPCVTKRKQSFNIFYRNESSIEDFITVCGGSHSLFEFFDASVKKNLRNTENRATNCVAKNIFKSVEAAAKQISAIEALKFANVLNELSDELKTTADIRINNPDMSLAELALLHEPPISKSGLNHRLSKIVDEASKRKLI